ncbi:MAG: hypothetical protein L6Q40_11150, partial [Azonexus sp.]|nr:hypothetical protein [Azonexus sp.]
MNKFSWLVFGALGLTACTSERFVLLPSPEGRATAIVIRDADGERVVSTPYAGIERGVGGTAEIKVSAEEVQARYGEVLQAMPLAAKSYTLYFQAGSNQLTPASEAEYARVREEITAR